MSAQTTEIYMQQSEVCAQSLPKAFLRVIPRRAAAFIPQENVIASRRPSFRRRSNLDLHEEPASPLFFLRHAGNGSQRYLRRIFIGAGPDEVRLGEAICTLGGIGGCFVAPLLATTIIGWHIQPGFPAVGQVSRWLCKPKEAGI